MCPPRARLAILIFLAVLCAGEPAARAEPDHPWGWVVVPVPFYSPKTSVGLAAALVIFDDSPAPADVSRRDDQLKVVLQATVKKQFSLTGDGIMYWRDGQYRLDESAELKRFPEDFWGVGPDAPDSARDSFTEQRIQSRTGFSARIWEEIYAGGQATVGYYRTANVTDGGAVSDYLMTHPAGGWLAGAGPVIRRDTRDDALGPHQGSLTSLSATFFRGAFEYQLWELDQRMFLPFDEWGVLAWQVFGRYAPGLPPLDDLPALGGTSRLRGYYDGRYRDTLYLMTQVEWRVRVWRRLSLAPFGAVGNVYPDVSSIFGNWLKVAGGLGTRYSLVADRDLNARLDVAVGIGSFAFYVNLGEAF